MVLSSNSEKSLTGQILEKKYAEVLSSVAPDKISVVGHDLDDSLFRRGDSQIDSLAKVSAETDITTSISRRTGKTLLKTIITGRPASALLTKPAIAAFLELKSIVNISGQIQTIPMPKVFAELGSVSLTNTDQGWQQEIVPFFRPYCQEIRPELEEWLNENYVQPGMYQFEQGTLVSLSLQATPDNPFDKMGLAQEIMERWKREGKEKFSKNVKILTEGADVDFHHRGLFRGGKILGLAETLDYWRRFVPSLSETQLILVDDTGTKASRHAALSGIRIIAPANSSPGMISAINALDAGIVASKPGFDGVMLGLQELLT